MPHDDDPSEAVIDAFVEYERRVSDGYDSASELQRYKERLGAEYRSFEDLVQAREAIMDVVDPPPIDGLPEQFGPFTLLDVLGSGGSGMVYDAYDARVQRHVAVKLLRGGFERDGETFRRFLREAAAAAKVEHPNIVTIHSAGEHDRKPFLAMERIDGPTLKAWARERPPTRDYLTTASRIADVADALASLHEVGIVHRDVKPSNIMVRSDGSFVLMDFGLAHGDLGTTVTQTGEVIGTPVFMSPQQLRGDRATAADDVYGLGLTLYYLITSETPMQDVTPLAELARRRAAERPPKPTDPALPSELVDITRACLEVDPADRPTAAELRDGLRHFVRGEPARIRPVSAVVHSQRRLRRILPIAAVAATVIGLLLYGWFTRSTTLEVRFEGAVASVSLDEQFVGTTPVRTELEPGRNYRLDLQVGQHLRLIQAVNTEGDLSLTFGLEDVDGRVVRFTSDRGTSDLQPFLFVPAGKVRREDLGSIRAATTGSGHISLAAGPTPLRHPFNQTGVVDVTIPQRVREIVEVDVPVEVEMRDAAGDLVTSSSFVVTDDDAIDEAVRALEEVLDGVSDSERRFHVSRLLAKEGYRTAAFNHLMEAWPETTTPEHVPLYAGIGLLLREMGATQTALSELIELEIQKIPAEQRNRWFAD